MIFSLLHLKCTKNKSKFYIPLCKLTKKKLQKKNIYVHEFKLPVKKASVMVNSPSFDGFKILNVNLSQQALQQNQEPVAFMYMSF